MKPSTIVAIEIGSSKIKGAAARTDSSGAIDILAVEETPGINIVRHGRIQNVMAVADAVNEIVRRLENNPAVAPGRVNSIILPLGGRSMCSIPASSTLSFSGEICITDDTVNRLKQEVLKDTVTGKTIQDIIPRIYYVNNMEARQPVGTYARQLRGDFLLVACDESLRQNLERLHWDSIDGAKIRYVLRPLALGDLLLTSSEKQLGCMLVDMGAETTTVTIYRGGTPAYLATLPIGSRLITRDLMAGMSLTEDRAETFKITLGNAADDRKAPQDNTQAEVNNYVRARAGEIAANIVNQMVVAGVKASDLPEGIIITGGGAQLREFCQILGAQSKTPVRQAQIPPTVHFASPALNTAANIDIVAMLSAGLRDNAPEGLVYPAKPQPEQQRTDTREYRHDDPDLLKDDDDDDDTQQQSTTATTEEVPHVYDGKITGEDAARRPGRFSSIRDKIAGMRSSFVNVFSGVPEEEDDSDYEADLRDDEDDE